MIERATSYLYISVLCLLAGVMEMYILFLTPAALFIESPVVKHIHPYIMVWVSLFCGAVTFYVAWTLDAPFRLGAKWVQVHEKLKQRS